MSCLGAGLALLAWVAVASAQTSKPQSQTSPPPSPFVGSNVCQGCHADIWMNFYKNPHFKSVASGKEPPERTGCEGCHGPGRAHVDAGGDINTVVHAFSVMKPQEIISLCLNCHAQEFNR